MALITRYVDTDATGSGDGTSWADAYTSLNVWEEAEQTNLVSDGDSHIVYCRASSGMADTTRVSVDGWETDAEHTLTIEAADNDAASTKWDANKYYLSASSSSALFINENYTTVNNIQIKHTGSETTSTNVGIKTGSYVTQVKIDGCFTIGGYYGITALITQNIKIITIVNNICISAGRAGITGVSTFTYYNNTAVHCNHDLQSSYGCGIHTGSEIRNNIAYDNYYQDYRYTDGDYNLSSDGTAPGSNSLKNQSDPFMDYSSSDLEGSDYSLASDSNAIDAGIGPSSDSNVPTTDINGETRSGTTCDIGAAEYVTTGTTFKPFWAINATRIAL